MSHTPFSWARRADFCPGSDHEASGDIASAAHQLNRAAATIFQQLCQFLMAPRRSGDNNKKPAATTGSIPIVRAGGDAVDGGEYHLMMGENQCDPV
jgi:hypothetical protein